MAWKVATINQVRLKGEKRMKYKITKRDAFQVIGVKREFIITKEEDYLEIPKFWNEIHENGTYQSLLQLNNGQIKGTLGISVDKSTSQSNQLEYWIATEYSGEVPNELSTLHISASKWAVFEVHGVMPDAILKIREQVFSEWLPSHEYEQAATPELEVFSDIAPSDPNFYGELWIPLK